MPSQLGKLPAARAALAYAEQLHAGQHREVDGAPFIVHPTEVAALLYYAGVPEHVIAAGALHDTIEKTRATEHDLRRRFGARVTELVLALTETPQIRDYEQRKAALREQITRAGDYALMILAADKLSKARELKLDALQTATGDAAAAARSTARGRRARTLAHHRRCLELLEQRLADSPLVAELRAELEALGAATYA